MGLYRATLHYKIQHESGIFRKSMEEVNIDRELLNIFYGKNVVEVEYKVRQLNIWKSDSVVTRYLLRNNLSDSNIKIISKDISCKIYGEATMFEMEHYASAEDFMLFVLDRLNK